ncbi:MAG: hypothetical protein SF053_16695 [Bacteroidia bacterium]|nr:hypothetical protein [Bacteroidia bacterium]
MSVDTTAQYFSLLYVFGILRKYLGFILIVIVLSLIAAIILTTPYFYPPEYMASATVYPTGAERFDLTNIFYEEPNLYLYGSAKEVEKLENIANSEDVKIFVLDSLNLWEVYGVNKTTDPSPKYKAFKTWAGNVRTIRGSGNGLTIEAYDTDPVRAAAIVNLIVYKVDEINKEMLNQNKRRIVSVMEEGARQLEQKITVYTDSARALRRKYNVLRALNQSEIVTEQVMIAEGEAAAAQATYRETARRLGESHEETVAARARLEAARARANVLTGRTPGSDINLRDFRDGMDKVKALEDICEEMATDIENTREKISYLTSMNEIPFSTMLIPEIAQPADKKARPVRWIILAATLLITTLVSIMGAVLAERIRESLQRNAA